MKNTQKHSKQLAGLWLALLASAFQVATPNYFWNHPAETFSTGESVFPASTELSDADTRARVSEAYGKLPMSFEANDGQADSQVKFLSRGAGYNLFLTPNEAVLELRKENETSELRMRLVGANPQPRVEGLNELSGKSNYIIGNDPAKWRKNVSRYAKVRYENVYPGVDLVYYGSQREMEYDFVLAPGADPRSIKLSFEGTQGIHIDAQGDLVLSAEGVEVRHRRPVLYQESEGIRKEIAGRFLLEGDGEVKFEVGSYDESKPLVIDPVLIYSTYLGGSGFESVVNSTVDSSGNMYLTGSTDSEEFPTINAFQSEFGGFNDAFVTKLDADGGAVYSTYLGGSRFESFINSTVDSSGNVYVTGSTDSEEFPTINAFQSKFGGRSDAFVAKLDANGMLIYSTYLGGSGFDSIVNSTADSSGNVYVTGSTDSEGFPTMNAFQSKSGGRSDAFVAKLDADGGAVYSTYLGGSGFESFINSTADSSGNVYITGSTDSEEFPLINAFQSEYGGGFNDAFVAKLDANGVLIYSTYLGGSGSEFFVNPTVDSSGNIYLTGSTGSTGFPLLNAFQSEFGGINDAFVTKLDADGGAVYSTYLGGSRFESFINSTVDSSGNVYVIGDTDSEEFPTMNAFQSEFGGGSLDSFLTKLGATGTPVYSTYLGGANEDFYEDFTVDASGNFYIAGETKSKDFPISNAFQSKYSGGFDVYLTKLGATGTPVYSTYIGGSNDEVFRGFTIDSSGNAYISGTTASANFPTRFPFQPVSKDTLFEDAFLTKLSATGSLLYSTYLGGRGTDVPHSVVVTTSGNVYIVGATGSPDFPVSPAAFQQLKSKGDNFDLFITKIEPARQTGGFSIINVSFIRKTLYVVGEGFDDGSAILLNGERQETKPKKKDPSVLISVAAGKKIKPGQTVTIQVRSSDGRVTDEFRVTL